MTRIFTLACLLLVSWPALAACPSSLQIKDNAGLTPQARYSDDGNGNCVANIQATPKIFAIAGTALTRPANTTAYTANNSISNSTTAGSVTAMPFTISDSPSAPVTLERLRIDTTETGIAGINVRVYLYSSDPTASSGVQAGDGAAFSNKKASLIGTMSGTCTGMFDGALCTLSPDVGARIDVVPGGAGTNQVWWQLQTLGAFTPLSASTFTPTLEGQQGRS